MAILNVSGIQFSDSTTLFSKYGIIPQNSVAVFYQANAPTGWTKLTTHNNKALRVVSGTGGGFGFGGISGAGGISFTSAFPSDVRTFTGSVTATGTVGGTTLTVAQIPSHSHAAGSSVTVSPGSPGVTGRLVNDSAPNTSLTGGGGSHTHPFAGSSAPFTSSIDLRVQYIDVIICTFN
jgi:hypothetical protein